MTTQDLLTLAAEFVLIGSIALYTALFLDGFMKRSRPAPGQLEIDFSAAVEPEPIAPVPPAPTQPRLESVVLPFRRPAPKQEPIDLAGKTIRELKAIASAVKLPKYNVESKAKLADRLLNEVPHDRLLEAIAAA